jgi:hypothetical protein
VINGKPHKIWSAFEGLLEDENIKALRMALKKPTKQQVNDAIDDVLRRIVLGDGSFKRLVAELLKEQTFASSFDLPLLYCLCNFIEDEDPQLRAIVITGDVATSLAKQSHAQLSFLLTMTFPVTTDLSIWYAPATIFALVMVLALAVYGFYISLGGQSVFGGKLLREE